MKKPIWPRFLIALTLGIFLVSFSGHGIGVQVPGAPGIDKKVDKDGKTTYSNTPDKKVKKAPVKKEPAVKKPVNSPKSVGKDTAPKCAKAGYAVTKWLCVHGVKHKKNRVEKMIGSS